MIVGNDVTVDTRVRKMAHDVALAGPRVTVLGISTTGQREEAMLGSAKIIRLPVSSTLRDNSYQFDEIGRLRRIRQRRHSLVTQRLFFLNHQREVGAQIGWIRREFFERRTREREETNRYELAKLAALDARRHHLLGPGGRSSNSTLPTRFWRLLARADKQTYLIMKRLRNRRRESRLQRSEERFRRTESNLRAALSRRHDRMEEEQRRVQALIKEGRGGFSWPPFRSSPNWRELLPELHDYDAAFAGEIDALAPDVIHAHDVHLLGVAARAVGRAYIAKRTPRLIYDAHEYVQGLARYSPQILAAWASLEREYLHRADHIITVSKPLAALLQRDFGLAEAPLVVMNTPVVVNESSISIREAAGLEGDQPLIVYSGGLDPTRGVHTLVEAIAELPEAHLAIVSKATTNYVQTLQEIAGAGGYGDRVHLVPFVAPQHVVSYLESATVAVHPMTSGPMNHQIALPNKIFEYMHARLPVVVSDCKAMADLVQDLGIGEVFRSEDAASLTDALKRVLGAVDRYRAVYDMRPDLLEIYSWPAQRDILLRLYQKILGEEAVSTDIAGSDLSSDSHLKRSRHTLGVGPQNMAGQAWAWAKAVEQHQPGFETEVFELVRPHRLTFPADLKISSGQWKSLDWQLEWAKHVAQNYTHVLLESGAGLLGNLNGGGLEADLAFLNAQNIRTALILHGSEVRDPVRHRILEPFSPFTPGAALTERLKIATQKTLDLVASFDGAIYLSTWDLFDYVPDARWLPIVVSPGTWESDLEPLTGGKPKVLFVPTSRELKGGSFVESTGGMLHEEGVIDLHIETNIAPSRMPRLIKECDVLIDGLVLGLYGTTSVEGLAAGRLVLANLGRVKEHQPDLPPILHTTPETLELNLREIAAQPDHFRTMAAKGPEFVRLYHDGRHAAENLEPFLNQ